MVLSQVFTWWAFRQSGSNTAAIKRDNRADKTALMIRHSRDFNNLVEQDHRAVKRLTRPRLGVKSFGAARCPLAGIAGMTAICNGQLVTRGTAPQTSAEQFYVLPA